MKLNKAQFKKILKECIRELITEGAFDTVIKENVAPTVVSSGRRPTANDFASSFGGGAPVDPEHQPAFNSVGHMTPNARLQELSRVAAHGASGGDPAQAKMMEAIFADTASTTLQSQLGYESHGSAGIYTGEDADPEQERQEMAALDVLSGGRGAGHWAALAFGKYNK